MKAKTKAKRNVFTLLGWLLWKLLALFGSRWAKKKLDDHQQSRRGGTGPVSRGVRALGGRSRS